MGYEHEEEERRKFRRLLRESVEPAGENPPDVVGSSLAGELGSDTVVRQRGYTDMRRLSVLEREDLALLLYSKLRGKKTQVWKMLYDEYLNLMVSVGGRGRRDIIRMEGVSRGGLPSVSEEIPKPNIIARNIWDRGWKKRVEEDKI